MRNGPPHWCKDPLAIIAKACWQLARVEQPSLLALGHIDFFPLTKLKLTFKNGIFEVVTQSTRDSLSLPSFLESSDAVLFRLIYRSSSYWVDSSWRQITWNTRTDMIAPLTGSLSAGIWRVSLDPVEAGGPYNVTATCENSIATLTDVLFGDIWLCVGQSNMAFKTSHVSSLKYIRVSFVASRHLCQVVFLWQLPDL